MLLRFYGSDTAFGQFWVMCDGKYGGYGNSGNEESITCRFYWDRQSSNPTLSAKYFILNYLANLT